MVYGVGALSSVQKGGSSESSGIVVYNGGGDIVFGAKMSNQWMQWNSGIRWWGIVFSPKKVKSVEAVSNRRSTQWMQ